MRSRAIAILISTHPTPKLFDCARDQRVRRRVATAARLVRCCARAAKQRHVERKGHDAPYRSRCFWPLPARPRSRSRARPRSRSTRSRTSPRRCPPTRSRAARRPRRREAKTTAYIVERMKAAGLKPGNNGIVVPGRAAGRADRAERDADDLHRRQDAGQPDLSHRHGARDLSRDAEDRHQEFATSCSSATASTRPKRAGTIMPAST